MKYLSHLAKKSAIKRADLTLDKSVIAGLGNIYTDEVLYRYPGVPTRARNSLTVLSASELSPMRFKDDGVHDKKRISF